MINIIYLVLRKITIIIKIIKNIIEIKELII